MTDSVVWRMPVARWTAWGRDVDGDEGLPDVAFIEPLLRRRLSPLARAALHVANACAQGHERVQLVHASRHGELARTVDMLGSLARGEDLSPTTFSLSVLNSAAGVFAIARGDASPATAIAAGIETFGFGLLEAYARACRQPGLPVLYVYADAPAPAPLGRQGNDPEGPVALALLIDPAADRILETTMVPGSGAADGGLQALAGARALSGEATAWSSGHRQWQWICR